ncbi:MAG: lipopolysaccharide kinase InaA family protein [Pseudomonadota bacterium]|nr:lipopolysaccharide kinase InaA family protein [Pseudomonadota bacterium]
MQKLKDGVRGVTLGVREARNFERIATCGVNTPELVAYGNSTSWLVPHHSYLIMKEIRPAETLWDYVRRTRDTSIATEAGELLWMIHCHGLVHRDLHSKNILLKQDGNGRRLYVIDMLGVGPSSSQSERIVELVRFLRKHGRVWLNEEAVDLFCLNYYQLGREPVEKYRDYNQFRDIIDKELSKYRSYGET